MKESQVCTRIVKEINEKGHYAFKIPDMPRTGGTQFIRKKPCDIVCGIQQTLIFIEVKVNKSFPGSKRALLNLLTTSQIVAANEVEQKGAALYYIFLCRYKPSRKASERIHELYVIPWDLALQFDRKGIRERIRLKPHRFKKGQYNIDRFLRFYG